MEAEIGSDIPTQETGLHKQLKEAKIAAKSANNEYGSASAQLESKLSKKATDRPSGIKYNAERYGDQNYTIIKIKRDISIILASNYTHLSLERKTEYENIIREQEKPIIEAIQSPTLLFESHCSRARELLSRQIGTSNKLAELLHDAALNDWVKRGSVLLDGKDICAFCGNPITNDRWDTIHGHFDEESKKLEAEIDALLLHIEKERAKLQVAPNIDKSSFYVTYHQQINEFIKKHNEVVEQYCQQLQFIATQLNNRKEHITESKEFFVPTDYSNVLVSVNNGLNAIIVNSNSFSHKLSTLKATAQKALRLQEVADFIDTIEYEKNSKGISKLEVAYGNAKRHAERLESMIKTKLENLQAKRRQLNDEEEGACLVNKYLNDYFGHNFISLQAEKTEEVDTRIRFRIVRNGEPAYNLSGGECSLIAFCYFVAKLDDVATKDVKPIIWIDDPISSLDGNHIYFLYSLILSKIVKPGNFEQLFISTHNLDFLKYLRRLFPNGKNDKRQCFLVERNGVSSSLIKMPKYLSDIATEFNYLFSIIYKCSRFETVTDDNFDILYGFGNAARKFLEILLYFRYPDVSEKSSSKLERFFKPDEIPPILIHRMTNEDSHGMSPERALKVDIDPETIPVAKRIINKLQEDTEQYNSLLKSIGIPQQEEDTL